MKCFVKYVGVLDMLGVTHSVEFFQGLNIITGKSSTGKSAIIEIFDYCFGSSDFTVPEGIITANADIYFTALQFPSFGLVVARRGESDSCFIRALENIEELDGLKHATNEFFNKEYFMPLADFKKELGRYFNVTLTDVDEDTANRGIMNRKSPTPSIRSFTSFMLQHQNLVANKHAIFFRFDEKEKREQTIDHFKVFLGIADQEYFILSQRLNAIKQDLRKLDFALPRKIEENNKAQEQISKALDLYSAISGTNLINLELSSIVANPKRALELIDLTPVQVNALSDTFDRQRSELEQSLSGSLAKLRGIERKRNAARASIQFAENFKQSANSIHLPDSADFAVSACPFCASNVDHLEHEANKLSDAIQWLNDELRQSSYMRESFLEDERKLSGEMDSIRQEIKVAQDQLALLDKQTADLEKRRPVSELALMAKLRVESVLDLLISRTSIDLELQKQNLENELRALNLKLGKYNMGSRIAEISNQVNAAMQDIGQRFDFEESYRPINLKFSFETFDLWHERKDGKKIFLRAMGSGANWLYCHLTLFLALHKVFAINSKNGNKIPPILFLDQPTQVYFPNFSSDAAENFDPKNLAQGTARQNNLDEDLRAVVSMYNELVRFCDETEKVAQIRPQIIVTDHADHLELGGTVSFESFVRARWRSRGFIEVVPS